MKNKKFNITTISLVLIPAAVGINYIGKLFAQVLRLPLWIDSIGTILASILAGPLIGAISGAVNNIVYGFTADPVSFLYGITSIAIGIVAGILSQKGLIKNLKNAILSGLLVGIVASVVSTPINVTQWGGTTGNVWGDALFGYLINKDIPIWIASFLDEIVVDVPDKVVVVVISYLVYKTLPINIKILFSSDNDIKNLD